MSSKGTAELRGTGFSRPFGTQQEFFRTLCNPAQARARLDGGEGCNFWQILERCASKGCCWSPSLMFIGLTRLRIRSFRFVPAFVLHTSRALRQVKKAAGFQRGALLADRNWTFWTMTAWDSPESMRRFMTTGSHKKAMPQLLHWCDQASVVHWEQTETSLPSWAEADKRMRAEGRASKVQNPSPEHATLAYRTPRSWGGAAIKPS